MESYAKFSLQYLNLFGNGVDPDTYGIDENFILARPAKRLKISEPEPIEYARWYRDEGNLEKAVAYFKIITDSPEKYASGILKEAYVNIGYISLLRLIPEYDYFTAHEMFGKAAKMDKDPFNIKFYSDIIIFLRKQLERYPKNKKMLYNLWMIEGHSERAKHIL